MTDKTSTATIKGSKDFDAPWLVVGGYPAEIRAQIIELLDFQPEAVKDYSTAQLLVEASIHFQALYAAAKTLGARPLPVDTANTHTTSGPTGEGAWAAAGAEAAPAKDPLVSALENASSVAEIGDLWREHKSDFERPEVAAAAAAARKRIDGGAA